MVHAYYIKQNNLIFEEYIQHIQEQVSLYLEKDDISYYIYHQTPLNGMINIPEVLEFTISNDNTGGYIITAW
jgi:NADPH-dependent curcumin reductase CurA